MNAVIDRDERVAEIERRLQGEFIAAMKAGPSTRVDFVTGGFHPRREQRPVCEVLFWHLDEDEAMRELASILAVTAMDPQATAGPRCKALLERMARLHAAAYGDLLQPLEES